MSLKLDIIRKSKALFMKWQLHEITEPFGVMLHNVYYMSRLSNWRKKAVVTGYNDWYQGSWDYSRRIKLYEAISQQEHLATEPMDYMEFGVSKGVSFRWWLEHNQHPESKFYGFDTFEGLPEAFGPFGKGAMAASLESIQVTDPRASFYKGLFQDTLVPFLDQYNNGRKKLIHMDADLFSAALFTFTQLYRFLNDGDILLFDEFAVPTHEFKAFEIFVDSFYLEYEVIGAANNYLFLAIKVKK